MAVPDRDEQVSKRASRPQTTSKGGAFDGRAARATRQVESIWLEPYPDVLLEGLAETAPGPEARYETREAVGLAFVAALQHLPPRQRAARVLRDVLGFRTPEVSEMLDSSEASVKGALQRARATVDERMPAAGREQAPLPRSARERKLVGRFAAAVERGDIEAALSLLMDDARLTMPPQPLEYQGREAIAAFLYHRAELRGTPLRVVPTRANTQPAFGCYLPDAHAPIARPYGLIVLTVEGDAIAAITWFADTAVFRQFGLPRTVVPRARRQNSAGATGLEPATSGVTGVREPLQRVSSSR
jgi:RNA polymerase sigma-70 factor (TIGR02960 family)